jgi:branched-chain amino acid transport system substrate-binding protein
VRTRAEFLHTQNSFKGEFMFHPIAARTLAVIAVASVAALAFTGCSSTTATSGSTKNPIKIGIVADLTGNIPAGFGGTNPQVDGMNAAIKLINADGGINGRDIVTDSCDTQSGYTRGPVCAQQFIANKDVAVFGFSAGWSPTGLAATDKAGIINSTYPNTTQEVDNPYSFPMLGGGVNSYPAQAKYLTADKHLKNAAIFYLEIPIGLTTADIYETALKRYGATKVTKIGIPLTAADLSTYVTAAKQAGAQAIYSVEQTSTMILAIKAASQIGYKPAWALGDAAVDKGQIVTPLGALAQGVYGSSSTVEWTTPSNPDTKVFLDAMKKYDPSVSIYQNTATGFASAMTFATALKAYKGSYTGAALKKYFSSLSGIHVFMGGGATLDASKAPSAHPHDLNPAYNIVQWQNGNAVVVKTNVNGWSK